jgi:hypothetical protein
LIERYLPVRIMIMLHNSIFPQFQEVTWVGNIIVAMKQIKLVSISVPIKIPRIVSQVGAP